MSPQIDLFQLRSISVGSEKLYLERMHPDLLKKTQKIVVESLLKEKFIGPAEGPIKVRLIRGELFIKKTGDLQFQKISVSSSQMKSLRNQVNRTVDFAHQVDLSRLLKDLPKRAPLIIGKMKADTNTPQVKAATIVSSVYDAYSISRQVLMAIYQQGYVAQVLNGLGIVNGTFILGFSLRSLFTETANVKTAEKICDGEGARRARANISSACSYILGSIFWLMNKGFELGVSPTCSAAVGLGAASVGVFGIGSIIGIGMSSLGIYRCRTFRNRLDQYLENPNLSEKERLSSAIHFLRDSIIVNEREIKELLRMARSENPVATKSEIQDILKQKIKDKTESKINHLKRRTSLRSLSAILDHSDQILAKLNSSTQEGIEEAKALIGIVKEDNRKKEKFYILMLVSSILGLAALIASSIATAGIAPMVLFALSSAIMLFAVLFNYYKTPQTTPPLSVNS